MMNNLCILTVCKWTQFLTPAIAIIGIIIAYIQLRKNSITRRADFIHRLDVDFFTNEARACIELIYLDLIRFIEQPDGDDAYFKIDKEKIEKLSNRYFSVKEFAKKRDYEINFFEIDDYLLGHFEKVGLYLENKVMDIAFIYGIFDFYIQLAYDNKEIQKYLKWCRKEEYDKDIYDKFELVAKESRKYGLRKNK
jgi:hypothetical protein